MRDRTTPIHEISALIRDRLDRRSDREVCLFLGAGADISSGGMTFAEFKREFFRHMLGRPTATASDATIEREVNAFLSQTSEQERRARLVEATFEINQKRHPSDAYMLLALALEKRAVDAVITTNFDTMLENAEQQLGISVLRVYAKGIALPDEVEAGMREPARVPYLKLHGCLNGRTITHITEEELLKTPYPRQFQQFLRRRLATADLIVAGYGGYDTRLAKLISQSLKDRHARVYWCNPGPPDPDAPLVKALGRRVIHIPAKFDEVIEAIAWPVLEAPSFTTANTIFIPCLLDWRVGHTNRDFLTSYGYRGTRDVRDLFVRRRSAEAQLSDFLDSDKPMTIVTGPSGVGKSVLGLRLLERYTDDDRCGVLLIPANSISRGEDFGAHLAARIGGLGSRVPFSFAEFESCLRSTGRRLVVYLDALNEHAVSLDQVSNLLREVIRFCYFLPQRPPIRVIVSVRQETWNRLSTREDRGRLAAVCWNPTGTPSVVHSVQLGTLTDEELREAIDLLCLAIGESSIFDDLPPQAVDRLRDPYLLAAVSDEVLQSRNLKALNWVHGPSRHIYDRIFKTKLAGSGSDHDPDGLETVLSRAAFLTIERGEDVFRAADLMKSAAETGQNGDLIRVFKDLGILADTEDGRLRFVHERTQEYFLAKALELPECPFSLRTPGELNRVLKELDHRHQVIAAIRTYFLFNPVTRFPLVANIIANPVGLPDPSAEDRLIAFAKELMVDLASDNPRDFHAWFRRTLEDVTALESGDARLAPRADHICRHWRAMIQAAAHLPDAAALEALTKGARVGTILARTEANIYATDKVVRLLLQRWGATDLLTDQQFGPYYADEHVPRMRRLGRVLGLMSQVGPDNTHPEEYAAVRATAADAFSSTLAEGPLTGDELDWFANFIFDERDRYVFNGSESGMKRFFNNPARDAFLPIYDRLEGGGVLRREDVNVLRPYIAELYQDLEFQLGNFLFIFSAANDLGATKRLWEDFFDTFDNKTPPDTVDFFQATSVYMYVVNGYDYDDLLDRHIDRILRECPQIIEYEPGRERGYARGFTDEFDMVFEDGFNPIASYATLLPSRHRKSMRWHDYVSQPAREVPLPVYARHLTEALHQGETRKALRIVHALGQFITLWPREGLWSMVGPVQHDHPSIHRAVVRVLTEAYNRYPVETLRFFANSGITLSPGDLRDIRARIDPRTGRRQFEGLQWGRVLHFLLSFPGARSRFFQALRIVYTAQSAQEAVHDVAEAFGWTKKTPSM
ncbi:MAG TPA: SIR2 family protein [Pyrinomonadaceae bacterium]